MITVVSGLLMMGISSGPATVLAYFFYIMCIMPFVGDMLISFRGAYNGMAGNTQGATVEEVAGNEEDFLAAEEREEEDGPQCVDPSQRLLPSIIT